jgi:tRNA A-37 threonylcarbamoyl transferase component Bud32
MSTIPRIGAELAGYRLEATIGRGGMSVVYLAEDIRLGRRLALKVLAPELAEDDRFRERFVRESKIAAGLDHPNVVPIFDAGEAEGVLYIAMRYVDGMDLKNLIRRDGPLGGRQALSILAQIGSALDAAHTRGLIHRDVKPANVLVDPETDSDHMHHVYLSDFGLVKHAASTSGITGTGQFVGTVDYVSPEQVQGHPVDHRADIYSLGCVFYECLAGGVPFPRQDDVAKMWAHVHGERPSFAEMRPEIADAIDPVIAKALAMDPEDRYATCRELFIAAREALTTSDENTLLRSAPQAFEPTREAPLTSAETDEEAVAGNVAILPDAAMPASVDRAPSMVDGAPATVNGAPATVDAAPVADEETRPMETVPHEATFPPADKAKIAAAAAVQDADAGPSVHSAELFPPPPDVAAASLEHSTVPAETRDVAAPRTEPAQRPGPGATPPGEGRRWSPMVVVVVLASVVVLAAGAVVLPSLLDSESGVRVGAPSPSPTASAPTPTSTPSPSGDKSPDAPRDVRPPTNFRRLSTTSTQVTLIWERAPNGGRVDHWVLYRDNEILAEDLTERRFTDTDVMPGTTYVYRVVAVGSDGTTARSEPLPVLVPQPPAPSPQVTNPNPNPQPSPTCTAADALQDKC